MKERTVVIHQPDFLPYLGFFHRLLHADLFVILDQVQFVMGTSRSWTNRDKIKTPNGEKWLSVSVEKASFGMKINEIKLSRTVDWKTQNLNLIKENYRSAPYYKEVIPLLQSLYESRAKYLWEFNIASIKMLLDIFQIPIEIKLASEMSPQGSSNELLVDILQKVGASVYLSGVGARAYYDPHPFEQANIRVDWQQFTHPVYSQLHGDFLPFLSSIDLLFNCGIEQSRHILRSI